MKAWEAYLPRARPMLDIHLALLRGNNIVMPFGINETLQAVFLREPRHDTLTVLPGAASKINRGADL